MTFIYSFLQKRKMHESQHGIIMVVTAYMLSVLMLVLGSDVFYNIKTTAADMNEQTQEETEQLAIEGVYQPRSTALAERLVDTDIINPYSIMDGQTTTETTEEGTAVLTPEDNNTVWFLGNAMDTDTFDRLMGSMNNIVKVNGKKAVGTTKKATAKKITDKKSTRNYTVTVASSNSVITVKSEEIKMLERIVEAEASGEDMVGKILIANVIFNRMADDEFPDTAEEVIFQEVDGDYQFSPIANNRYWEVSVSKESKKAVERAMDGEDYSDGALYFIARKRTTSSSAAWFDNNLKWLFQHGGHEFYKNR